MAKAQRTPMSAEGFREMAVWLEYTARMFHAFAERAEGGEIVVLSYPNLMDSQQKLDNFTKRLCRQLDLSEAPVVRFVDDPARVDPEVAAKSKAAREKAEQLTKKDRTKK